MVDLQHLRQVLLSNSDLKFVVSRIIDLLEAQEQAAPPAADASGEPLPSDKESAP